MKLIAKWNCLLLTCLLLSACGSDNGSDEPEPSPTTPTPTGTVTISKPEVSEITSNSAQVRALVTASSGLSVTSKGFCYSTSSNPTTDDKTVAASINDMLATLSALDANTTYYVKGYAVSAIGTTYSEATSFKTEEMQGSELDNYAAPAYADDYRSIADWSKRAQWNLANVHDPSVVLADDGYYYMYQTDASFGNAHTAGGHFHARRSKNLIDWEYLGGTMKTVPSWVKTKLNDIRKEMGLEASTTNFNNCGYWAPCVRKVKTGLYRMYYVITIDGTINGANSWGERAFIGLAENSDPANNDGWEDKGYVLTNYSDKELNFNVSPTAWQQCYFKWNAIDPSYIIDTDGRHWLVYGSWHSGFPIVEINPETGKTIVDPLPNPWGADNAEAYGKRIFTRKNGDRWQGAEAPEVVYRNGYYYLFLAYDALDVPYNTRVVRAEKIDGPYKNIDGTDVTNGTTNGDPAYPILTHPYKFSGSSGWVGISHCAIFNDGNDNWYYASQARFPTDYPIQTDWAPNAVMLGHIRSIRWTKDGWPVVMPERYGAVPQVAITEADIVGDWDHIDLGYSYGKQKTASTMTFGADHTITAGTWKGAEWSFDAATNTLTANGVELLLQRECDWEASPRHATIIYAGINKQKTYWGKKK